MPSRLESYQFCITADFGNMTFIVFRPNLLVFNIGNGRFAAELMAEQKKADRDLDPTKPEDAKIVQRLLLDQNAEEAAFCNVA